MSEKIGEITVPVMDLSKRCSISLVQEAGKVELSHGREVAIMLAGRHIEYWIKDASGKTRYFGLELSQLSKAACALIAAHLDLEAKA